MRFYLSPTISKVFTAYSLLFFFHTNATRDQRLSFPGTGIAKHVFRCTSEEGLCPGTKKAKDENRYCFGGAPHTRKFLLHKSSHIGQDTRSIRNSSILAVRKKATLSMRLASSPYAGIYDVPSALPTRPDPSYSGCRLGKYHATTTLGIGRPVYSLLLLPCSRWPKVYL